MAQPVDADAAWTFKLLLSKGIAAVAAYAFYCLCKRWCKTDKWIAAYHAREQERLEEDGWL